MKEIRICFKCKKNFKFNNSPSRLGRGRFCSRICKSTSTLAPCCICQKEVKRMPSHISKKIYCSYKCMGLGMINQVEKTCVTCHRAFQVRVCEYRKFVTCSKQCSMTRKSGSGNSNWKGGISPLKELLRQYLDDVGWPSEIKARDNWTCQLCKRRGSVDLNADHYPIPFASVIRIENIKSLSEAKDSPLLNSLDNGRTLCVECHRQVYHDTLKVVMST